MTVSGYTVSFGGGDKKVLEVDSSCSYTVL